MKNPLFEIASDTYRDLPKSCHLCGGFKEAFRSDKPYSELGDSYMRAYCSLLDLPDDCWRPAGVVLIWDSDRIR